jgi:hypothetical protein
MAQATHSNYFCDHETYGFAPQKTIAINRCQYTTMNSLNIQQRSGRHALTRTSREQDAHRHDMTQQVQNPLHRVCLADTLTLKR